MQIPDLFRPFYAVLNWKPKNWSLMPSHDPESPREWDPNHPMLKSPLAPHETSGVLRMQRAGHTGEQIMKILKVKATVLTKQFAKAMDAEQAAADRGIPIHDSRIKRT